MRTWRCDQDDKASIAATSSDQQDSRYQKMTQNQRDFYEWNKDDPDFKAYNQAKTAWYREKKAAASATGTGGQAGQAG